MSYLEELKQRYKEARKRMEKHAIRVPPANNSLRLMRKPEPEDQAEKAGLVSEKAENEIVSKALKVVNDESANPHSQAYRMAEELINSPRLPPIPGLVLTEPGAVRWMRIMHAVAKQHGVGAADIMSQSRRRHIINARFEVFYRLRIDLGMSYMRIAALFNKDHSTVIHAVNKLRRKLLDEGKGLAEDVRLHAVTHSDRTKAQTSDLSAV